MSNVLEERRPGALIVRVEAREGASWRLFREFLNVDHRHAKSGELQEMRVLKTDRSLREQGGASF